MAELRERMVKAIHDTECFGDTDKPCAWDGSKSCSDVLHLGDSQPWDYARAVLPIVEAETRRALDGLRAEIRGEYAAERVEAKIREEWPNSTHRWSDADTTPHGWAHTALAVVDEIIAAHRDRA